MQANEILEDNSIESISLRTRIPEEALQKLFAGECAGMQKVHVQGFLSILEREYRADLHALRESCLGSLEGEDPNDSIVVTVPPGMRGTGRKPLIIDADRVDRGRYLKPLGIGLVALLLLYGAWSTLGVVRGESNRTAQGDVGFFSSVLRQIQKQTGIKTEASEFNASLPEEANEERAGEQVALTPQQDRAEDTTPAASIMEHNGTDKQPQTAGAEAQTSAASDTNSTPDLIPVIEHEPTARQGDNASADAVPLLSDETETNLSEARASEETDRVQSDQTSKSTTETAVAPTMTTDADASVSHENNVTPTESAASLEPDTISEASAPPKSAPETMPVVLLPRAKIWLGIVDLTTMKRTVITTKKPVPFSQPNGRWIVAVGHGRLAWKAGEKSKKFNDSQKHFFMIEKGTVREISHARFQKLNKSKVW